MSLKIIKMKNLVVVIFICKLAFGYSQDKGVDYKNLKLGSFSWGIDIGGGYTLLGGDVKKYLDNHGSFNGGFFFSYKKITCDLRFLAGYSTATRDFLSSEYYVKKDSANLMGNVESSFGYMIVENEFINFYPSIGFNILQMGHKLESDKSVDGPVKFAPAMGVSLDYKFYRQNAKTYLANGYIKTRITWISFNYIGDMNGSQFNIALTIGFYGRVIKN